MLSEWEGTPWAGTAPSSIQPRATEDVSTLGDFIARLDPRAGRASPWRPASVREAMGVPAIFGAVTLISNTTGSLTMRAYRDEVVLPDTERPSIIIRPDPFHIPRDFYRDAAYWLATRGETWWWVAARDNDDNALSLITVPPYEVTVEENPRDLRYPIIQWRGKTMPNADMRQLTYLRDPDSKGLRGWGPLQACGAAISVAVEAQDWAANFYSAGGHPSLLIKHAGTLGQYAADFQVADPDDILEAADHEAEQLRRQWMAQDSNVPRVIDQNIESVEYMHPDVAAGQMLEAREQQNVDAARMFNIPSAMLDAVVSGSSLTYQNVSQEFDRFVKRCLRPNYLEPIEQTMSDMLTRTTVARFNTNAILQDSMADRFAAYKDGVDAGWLTVDMILAREGIIAGDVENAPVPFSPPAAIPGPILARSSVAVLPEQRCDGTRSFRRSGITSLGRCNALLAREGAPRFVGVCRKCRKSYESVA